MRTTLRIYALVLATTLAGCIKARTWPDTNPLTQLRLDDATRPSPPPLARLPLFLVADNQNHNFLGGYVKSLGVASAKHLTKVAIRPPEVNLWSHHLLERLVDDALSGPDPAAVVIHLGDAANVACTNEFERLVSSMRSATAGRAPWIMAPGNHDSALAGNMNTWEILDPEVGFAHAFGDGKQSEAVELHRSWGGACASVDGTSRQLTKGRLVEGMIAALVAQNAMATPIKSSEVTGQQVPSRCQVLHVTPGANAMLEDRRYEALAVQCKPDQCAGHPDFPCDRAESFIVQRLVLGPRVVGIVLDTTDVGQSFGHQAPVHAVGFGSGTIAQHGEIGLVQRAAIARLLKDFKDHTIVGLGHSPFRELSEGARAFLTDPDGIAIATYISAHTHLQNAVLWHGRSEKAWGLAELNIGSIADWPTQSLRLGVERVQDRSLQLSWTSIGSAPGDERPAWMANDACHLDDLDLAISKSRLASRASKMDLIGYRSYRAKEAPRAYTPVRRDSPDGFGRLREVLEAAEATLDPSRAKLGPLREEFTRQLVFPFTTRQSTFVWEERRNLLARANALEALTATDPQARQYAICQVLRAARVAEGMRAGLEDTYEKPLRSANKQHSIVLDLKN